VVIGRRHDEADADAAYAALSAGALVHGSTPGMENQSWTVEPTFHPKFSSMSVPAAWKASR
jgi:hypothetical protein